MLPFLAPENQKCNITRDQVQHAWEATYTWLASQRNSGDYWTGRLSNSALSTATALSALVMMKRAGTVGPEQQVEVEQSLVSGSMWLGRAQNKDGGFGDTELSHSNIATTLLVQAAWQLIGVGAQVSKNFDAASKYVERVGRWEALRRRYGKDKTFVAPILTNCALAGLVSWDEVPTLPFEAAWLPQAWYRLARMPVVSYAIPALVAIGQAKFFHRPPSNLLLRWIRRQAIAPTLQVLSRMQPASGGFLEAVPLTSFVLMNLAAIGKGTLPVSQKCMEFLLKSRLDDGSWPIDTNLATWVTTLAINGQFRHPSLAQSCQPETADALNSSSECVDPGGRSLARRAPISKNSSAALLADSLVTEQTMQWLLSCQHLTKHPFTGAQPGGWGWTNLSGAVPDADDTPGALLALANWYRISFSRNPAVDLNIHNAVARGLQWLLKLQNRDGGWPTFCRGWGKLPFDRSGTDLTAHALRALEVWQQFTRDIRRTNRRMPSMRKLNSAINRGFAYLAKQQQSDGSWIPLWFGNQDHDGELNQVYGTSRVLLAYAELGRLDSAEAKRALKFLHSVQNSDGGWGGGPSVPYRIGSEDSQEVRSSIEETAVAIEALCVCSSGNPWSPTIMRGLDWLVAAIEQGNLNSSWPIGFYFAKLWYHERMYPAAFGISALGSALTEIGWHRD